MRRRKCPQCGTEMLLNCFVEICGAGAYLSFRLDDGSFCGKDLGEVNCAVCPECGETSMWIYPSMIKGPQ